MPTHFFSPNRLLNWRERFALPSPSLRVPGSRLRPSSSLAGGITGQDDDGDAMEDTVMSV